MEGVEVLPLAVHQLVVLPGLRDHHQHRVRQRAATEVQQLHHLVEGGRVGGVRGADREEPIQVAGQRLAGQQRLAGPHPVAVALGRVDLAVVGDHPERVRQLPGREGVGGEPRVHDGQRTGHPLIQQLPEHQVELLGGEHPLVDQGAGRQGREVDPDLVLSATTQRVRQPVQRDAAGRAIAGGHEQLLEAGLVGPGQVAQRGVIGGHHAPAEHVQRLFGGDRLDPLPGGGRGVVGSGQEGVADRVRTGRGQVETGLRAQEGVRDLDQDAGPVPGARVGTGGPAVVEVAEGLQALRDDRVARDPAEGRDERDTAGVVLVRRVVEAVFGGGEPWVQ